MFSKARAVALPPHWSSDYTINLVKDASLPMGFLFLSLSEEEAYGCICYRGSHTKYNLSFQVTCLLRILLCEEDKHQALTVHQLQGTECHHN